MKFDPFSWHEVKTNEAFHVSKGMLRLRCSAPCSLFLEAEGHEVCFGQAAFFEVEISQGMMARLEAPKGCRVFLHRPFSTSIEARGEVFTNIDRQPLESGSVYEVQKALRMLELEKRSALKAIRSERNALLADRAKQMEAKPEAKPEGDKPEVKADAEPDPGETK